MADRQERHSPSGSAQTTNERMTLRENGGRSALRSRRVVLALTVRKFVCTTPTCSRQIFTERLADLVQSYARMTNRLREATSRPWSRHQRPGERAAGTGAITPLCTPRSLPRGGTITLHNAPRLSDQYHFVSVRSGWLSCGRKRQDPRSL